VYSERYARLAEDAAARAKHHFAQARQILAPEDRRAMIAAQLMGSVYWRLLQQLQRQRFNVFGPGRVRLSRGEKMLLILRGWLRFFTGAPGDY
jgi:phytoene synthase